MVSVLIVGCDGYPGVVGHANAIAQGCARWLKAKHQVWLITDEEWPKMAYYPTIRVVKPVTKHWGWWHLMEQYRYLSPWGGGPVLSMGLDTVIVGDITWMVQKATSVYLQPFREQYGKGGAGSGGGGAGAIYTDGIVFHPDVTRLEWLWGEFLKEVPEEKTWDLKRGFPMHEWVDRKIRERGMIFPRWQEIQPGSVHSFKWRCREDLPGGTSVVCFHGEPRVGEVYLSGKCGWLNRNFTPWAKALWLSEESV